MEWKVMIRGILAIFLVITGLYLAFTALPAFSWFNWSGDGGKAVAMNKIENIRIETYSIHTTIITEDRKDVETEYEGKGKVTLQLNGDTLEIEAKGPRFQFFNVNSDKKKLTIYIPEDYAHNMHINAGSGYLSFAEETVQSPMKLKELSVRVGSGKIQTGAIEASSVEYKISSGEIVTDSLTTRDGVFKVSSGRLNLENYSGPAEADVSSGELRIKMKELTGPVEMDVSSGYAELALPENADFTLNGKISSGNINNAFPLTRENSNPNKIQGQHGTGKHKIDLNVSSGNISLH
jgi:lia operon protein LiaG